MYGFGSFGGDWGGFLSELVRVPFADHMLSPLPEGVSAEAAASVSDNVVDGWRLVAPGLEQWPGGEVLIAGGSPSIGLYGVQVALALGAARVVYCDVEGERLRKAEDLGAEVVDGYPERLGPFPITAMVAADPAALALALRSTAPDGVCTCAGIIFQPETPIPLIEMYTKITTFRDGPPACAAGDPPGARADGGREAAARVRDRSGPRLGGGARRPCRQPRQARLQPRPLAAAVHGVRRSKRAFADAGSDGREGCAVRRCGPRPPSRLRPDGCRRRTGRGRGPGSSSEPAGARVA